MESTKTSKTTVLPLFVLSYRDPFSMDYY